jgi:hypothetical protein
MNKTAKSRMNSPEQGDKKRRTRKGWRHLLSARNNARYVRSHLNVGEAPRNGESDQAGGDKEGNVEEAPVGGELDQVVGAMEGNEEEA